MVQGWILHRGAISITRPWKILRWYTTQNIIFITGGGKREMFQSTVNASGPLTVVETTGSFCCCETWIDLCLGDCFDPQCPQTSSLPVTSLLLMVVFLLLWDLYDSFSNEPTQRETMMLKEELELRMNLYNWSIVLSCPTACELFYLLLQEYFLELFLLSADLKYLYLSLTIVLSICLILDSLLRSEIPSLHLRHLSWLLGMDFKEPKGLLNVDNLLITTISVDILNIRETRQSDLCPLLRTEICLPG